MIFYNITASMPVKPDWASISGDLKAGTPLSIGGKAANDDAAFGLVQEDTAHGAEYVKVVYAGVADLSGASKSCGSAVSDDAVQAMNGLTFIYGGKIYNVVPSGLPDSSEASQGDVLTIGSSGPEWDAPSGGALVLTRTNTGAVTGATAAEIRAAAAAGTPLYIRWGNALYPAVYTYDEEENNIVESNFTIMTQNPGNGSWGVTAWRYRFAVNTSTLGSITSNFVTLQSAST